LHDEGPWFQLKGAPVTTTYRWRKIYGSRGTEKILLHSFQPQEKRRETFAAKKVVVQLPGIAKAPSIAPRYELELEAQSAMRAELVESEKWDENRFIELKIWSR